METDFPLSINRFCLPRLSSSAPGNEFCHSMLLATGETHPSSCQQGPEVKQAGKVPLSSTKAGLTAEAFSWGRLS